MGRNIGWGLMTKPEAATIQTVLLMYANGPALVTRTTFDGGTDITNPLASNEPETEYTTVCDLSGFTVNKGEIMRKTWDGYSVLERFWEPRHPQDMVRAKPERTEPKQGKPRPDDEFIDILAPITPDDL